MCIEIVIDTNVIIASLKSKRGASYKLLNLINSKKFNINVSVPLIYEYEQVIADKIPKLSKNDITDYIDAICKLSNRHNIYYLWRPQLKDPKDEMVLELAIKSKSKYIITYNKIDFKNAKKFGVHVLDAREFLKKIGELK